VSARRELLRGQAHPRLVDEYHHDLLAAVISVATDTTLMLSRDSCAGHPDRPSAPRIQARAEYEIAVHLPRPGNVEATHQRVVRPADQRPLLRVVQPFLTQELRITGPWR
jgi:hypothetical protein